MGLKHTTIRDEKEKERMADAWTADRTLWLASDETTVVEDGDPSAPYMLCSAVRRVYRATVAKYKLKDKPKARKKATAKKPAARKSAAKKPAATRKG